MAAAVALAVAAMSASAATGGHGVASAGQTTVTGTLITRPARTLAPGTAVRSNELVGQRVFVDAAHGFALASVGQAQYPAATSNGGRTWRTVNMRSRRWRQRIGAPLPNFRRGVASQKIAIGSP